MKIPANKSRTLIIGVLALGSLGPGANLAKAQVVERGLPPAGNTLRSFQDGAIARASEINQPLDSLNDFYPAIEVVVTDNDNVRRRPDFQEPDVRWEINPSLAYRTNLGRHQFYAAYRGTFVFHNELEEEDSEANDVSATLGLDLGRRWDLNLFASIGESFEQRGISGSRSFEDFINDGIDSGPEEISFRRFGGDLVFGRKLGVITGVLGYELIESEFSSSDLVFGLDENGRDRDSESVHFDIAWRFAPRTSVFARVERTEQDFTSQFSDLDSEQEDFLVGLRLKPTAAFSGVVGVGRTDREFDAPEREDFQGSIHYANLTYAINPLSTIELAASRTVEEAAAVDSDFFVSDLIGASWRHALSSKLVFNIYGKLIEDEFNDGREDEFTDWGLGIDYVFRDWLSVGVFYGETERESNVDNIAFDNQFVGLRLQSDIRRLFNGRGQTVDSLPELRRTAASSR